MRSCQGHARDRLIQSGRSARRQADFKRCPHFPSNTLGDTRGDNSDENECSTDNEEESAFLETLTQKLEKVKRVSYVTGFLRFGDRNNTFHRIVLDRRGLGAPKLVGASDDVVLTCDTGTGQIDIHFREYNEDSYNIGDDLRKFSRAWPQLDREGVYKRQIREMSDSLTKSMKLVRKIY